jgi:CDGSH-type Zn-finger protein
VLDTQANALHLEWYLLPSMRMAAKVSVINNGPLRIEGEFTIHDTVGNPFGLAGRTMISLCRCGHSENKPFCDGSHKRQGFQSECPARDLPPPAPKP